MTAEDLLAYIAAAIAVKETPRDVNIPPREYYDSVIQGFKSVYDTLCEHHLNETVNYLDIINGGGNKR